MKNDMSFKVRVWVCLIMIFACGALAFLNIMWSDGLTGDKPFSAFTQRDWLLFAVFLAEETLLFIAMFIFCVFVFKMAKKRNAELTDKWRKERILSSVPGQYDHVWIEFSFNRRALIRKIDKWYYLSVQSYDSHTGNWEYENTVIAKETLSEIGKTLFYEYHFYCEENTRLDKRGNTMYMDGGV